MKKIFTLLFLIYFGNNFCQAQHLWSDGTAALYEWRNTHGITTDNSGNVYTAGTFQTVFDADPGPAVTNLTPVGSLDVYITKFDANGNFIWAKSFGGNLDEHAFAIVVDAQNNIYVGGSFRDTVDFDPGPGITQLTAAYNGTSASTSGFISKFNSNGDFIWVRNIGGTSFYGAESIKDLALDNAGNIYVAGKFKAYSFSYSLDLDPGPGVFPLPGWSDYTSGFVVKLDANGIFINGGGINVGSNRSVPAAIVVKNDTVYIAANSDDDNDPTVSGFSAVNKYDLDLNQISSEPLENDIDLLAMDIDNSGNIYLGGDFFISADFDPGPGDHTVIVPAGNDMFICKLDNNGAFQWAKGFPQVEANLNTLKINPQSGDCFVAGYIYQSGYFSDSDPSSYVAGVGPWTGFVYQVDPSGNFKSIYPLLATSNGSSEAEPGSLFFDQSNDLFVIGGLGGEVDLDPSPQTVFLMSLPNGGTFLSKWEIRPGIDYYNTKANLGLENTGTWSTTIDGTGTSPQNFTDGAHFNVINQTNAVLSGVVHIAGFDSKLVIGDGVIPITLTVAPGNSYIDHTTSVEVLNNSSLILQNNIIPALKKAADGSYVQFAQTGTSSLDSIQIPAIRYYDLTLTGGLKNFEQDTTTVANNFIADAVASLGGRKSASVYSDVSYLKCLGNVTFSNGTAFEPESVTASLRRFGLVMNGAGPVQTITSNGTDIRLISLSRTSDSVCNVVLSTGTNLYLGSANGGGFSFKSANATFSCSGGSVNFINSFCVSNYADQGSINSNGTSFYLSRTSNLNYYFDQTGLEGKFRFIPGSSINNFSMSCPVVYSYNYFPMQIIGNITVTGELNMASGFIDLPTGSSISFASTATLNPTYSGNDHSFIQGTVNKTGSSDFYFPVGSLSPYGWPSYNYDTKFAPVELSNLSSSNTYTVFYKKHSYPVHTIDPLTLQSNPAYGISGAEYWTITPTIPGGSADIRFYYKDVNSLIIIPSALSIAHFDGTDWNDIGGTAGVANTLTSGDVLVTGVSTFSPFTFGGTANVVVPVKLTSFSARKQNSTVQLYWTTEQEINSKSFIIERSLDGIKWNEITRLNAAGNSSVKINYDATDYKPAKGINYYRLKQVDIDGRFTYSEIRSVYFGSDVNVIVAPNPAKDKVTVYLPGNSKQVSIKIFNINGQLMKQFISFGETLQLNVNDLLKGIYMIRISGEHLNEMKKLLVE